LSSEQGLFCVRLCGVVRIKSALLKKPPGCPDLLYFDFHREVALELRSWILMD